MASSWADIAKLFLKAVLALAGWVLYVELSFRHPNQPIPAPPPIPFEDKGSGDLS